MTRTMTELCHLARKHGTDKGGFHNNAGHTCHVYTPVYSDLFSKRRETVRNVLEIGVNNGVSLRLWEEYFPNAQIVGLDNGDNNPNFLSINTERITCYLADQSNPASLLGALPYSLGHERRAKYDFIVDDGSHVLSHQIISLRTLLPFLEPEGVYVVEDLQVSCKPETIFEALPDGFFAIAVPCPGGVGTAYCVCGCGHPDNLILIVHG